MLKRKNVLVLITCLFCTGMLLTSCSMIGDNSSSSNTEAKEDFPIIRYRDLKKDLESNEIGITIVDANSPETFDKGHLPNAFNFTKNKSNLEAKLPAEKDAKIIVYCGGRECEAWKEASIALRDMGYTNVYHYPGGLKGWQKKGEALVS